MILYENNLQDLPGGFHWLLVYTHADIHGNNVQNLPGGFHGWLFHIGVSNQALWQRVTGSVKKKIQFVSVYLTVHTILTNLMVWMI